MNARRIALILVCLAPLIGIAATTTPQDPQTQIQKLQRQLRAANAKVSDQQDQISAQDDLIGAQSDTIARLRSRIANWPAPEDVIANENADDQWAAVVSIWRSFPTLVEGQICGYDRSNTPATGDELTLTSFSFYRWQGC